MRVKRMSVFARICHLVGLAAVFAAPATAQEDPLTAVLPGGSGTLVLEVTGEDAARLTRTDGVSGTILPLPQDARVTSLAATDDGWVVAGSFPSADGSRRLFVRRGAEGEKVVEDVRAPDRLSRAPIRRSPVLLVDDGTLAGVAWLEGAGERALSVRASAWNPEGFSAPQRVSGVGPGTQTALRGTVLADGSWMLVWTAFDGTDDEVVWSRRVGESWLPVERLGVSNTVPDIVPAVTASGTGALAAWSRYDGRDYRLVGARFNGDEWTELPWYGPPGSLYPSFRGRRTAPALRHRAPPGMVGDALDGRRAGAPPRPGVRRRLPPAGADRRRGRPAGTAATRRGRDAVKRSLAPVVAVHLTAVLTGLVAAPVTGQDEPTVYIAFGDSITEGVGDSQEEQPRGYPVRLENLLRNAGSDAEVRNRGLGAERTPDGLTRLPDVLDAEADADVLLLMEGSNDISREISIETTRLNLAEMADRAESRGVEVVHATVIPRIPQARLDPDNVLNQQLNQQIRDLAGTQGRRLVDNFEVFGSIDDVFARFYQDVPTDFVGHPNAEGYDVMAGAFFDVLTGVDSVPPVPGLLEPNHGDRGLPPSTPVQVDVWDFGEGIDLAATSLLIDGEDVANPGQRPEGHPGVPAPPSPGSFRWVCAPGTSPLPPTSSTGRSPASPSPARRSWTATWTRTAGGTAWTGPPLRRPPGRQPLLGTG